MGQAIKVSGVERDRIIAGVVEVKAGCKSYKHRDPSRHALNRR